MQALLAALFTTIIVGMIGMYAALRGPDPGVQRRDLDLMTRRVNEMFAARDEAIAMMAAEIKKLQPNTMAVVKKKDKK